MRWPYGQSFLWGLHPRLKIQIILPESSHPPDADDIKKGETQTASPFLIWMTVVQFTFAVFSSRSKPIGVMPTTSRAPSPFTSSGCRYIVAPGKN